MAFTNSSLVSYTKISPNKTPNRNHAIDTITIHCVVGQCTVQRLGDIFAPTSRQASSNYGVGYDGKIGMYVEEKDRSWCSSNAENDHRAVTIEVASDTTEPYAVTEKAYAAMLDLVTDICKRNGIKKLVWSTDKNDLVNHLNGCNMTVHRDYANKSCPGTYLYERHGEIAAEVNKRLAADDSGSQGGASTEGYTKIMGTAAVTAAQMQSYIKLVNPSVAQSVIDMIPLYLSEGADEGVRGDIAFAQSCLETGNFGFAGSAVTLNQNNFCGMGVTANGEKGNSFDTPQLGIRAQIQHLKAYATTDALKNECIDPRFNYVARGCAEYVEWLGQQENPSGRGWAAGAGYGEKILSILQKAAATADSTGGSASNLYRVRKTWEDSKTQKGAYKILENAKKCADANPGYSVFDVNGINVYTSTATTSETKIAVPYLVNVTITNLNIRKGPGTDYAKTGQFTGIGTFTIVEESSGQGSVNGWGRLKSGAGWISLDFASKI